MTRTSTSVPAVPARPARAAAPAVQPWRGAALLLASAGALWFAWLGWDTTYDVDPVTGSLSGPYSWWQVAGFVLSAAVLVLAACRFLRPLVIVPAVAAGISAGFAFSARTDDSGLAAVGLVLVLLGSVVGASLLVSVHWMLSMLLSRTR